MLLLGVTFPTSCLDSWTLMPPTRPEELHRITHTLHTGEKHTHTLVSLLYKMAQANTNSQIQI